MLPALAPYIGTGYAGGRAGTQVMSAVGILNMGSATILLVLLAGCAGLGPSPDTEEVDSIRYDIVSCSSLVAARNALHARYPVLPKARGERLAMGYLAPLRDWAEAGGHNARVAKGRINAINDSLTRRRCPGAAPRIE